MGKLVVVCHVQRSQGVPLYTGNLKQISRFQTEVQRPQKKKKKKPEKKTVKAAEDSVRLTSKQKKGRRVP